MLVVTASWSFADGTLVEGGGRHVDAWRSLVIRAATRAGVRSDGRYAPVERIDVVLAGDTLDTLTSACWRDGQRPWHEGPRVAALRAGVQRAALESAAPLVTTLVDWVRRGLPVPAPDRHGRPGGAEVRVPLRVTALAGVGDAWIDRGPWPADIGRESSWEHAAVVVRHGADDDPTAAREADGRPSCAASLVVDLVVPFATRLQGIARLEGLARGFLAAVASVRPLDLPVAVAAWHAAIDPEARGAVGEAWRRAVAGWFRAAAGLLGDVAAGDTLGRLAARLERARMGEPRTVAECEEDLLPIPPRPPGIGRLLLLGHPPAAAVGDGVVCLGRPRPGSCRRGVGVVRGETPDVVSVAMAASGPVSVVCRDATGRTDWDWLGDEPPPSAPWRVAGPRVVDAA